VDFDVIAWRVRPMTAQVLSFKPAQVKAALKVAKVK
jgi:hypothetical protein